MNALVIVIENTNSIRSKGQHNTDAAENADDMTEVCRFNNKCVNYIYTKLWKYKFDYYMKYFKWIFSAYQIFKI